MKRYSPRTAKNANTQEILLRHLHQHQDRLSEFFADAPTPQPLVEYCRRGDFYLNDSAIVYISDNPDTRHGYISASGATAAQIESCCRFAFDYYTYHKIKANTPEPDIYLKAGFTQTGTSPNDALSDGHWVDTIAVEVTNPEWQVYPIARIRNRASKTTRLLHAAARAIKSLCGIRHAGIGSDVCT